MALGGFFCAVAGKRSFDFFQFAIPSAVLLVVDPGLGEEHVPFMAFLFHVVLLLFAGLFALGTLLRFEANFGLLLGGS